MNLPVNFLAPILVFITHFKYGLIFIGVIVEGPILMIASGFLLHKGIVTFWPLFATLVAGDLVADVGWYYLGYFFLDPALKRHGHFLSVTPEALQKAKDLFHRYHTKILFISKVTIGFGMALATLMVAGAARIPFRKYMLVNLLGELALVVALLVLGYFFGNMYDAIATGFRTVFVIGAAAFSALLIFGISRYAKTVITSS